MSNVTGVRFLAEYQMLGDMEGMDWMELVLGHAKREGLIQDFKPLTSLVGLWGIQLCVFTFDISAEMLEAEKLQKREEGIEWAENLISKIVGDSDVEVRWASTMVEQ